MNPTTGTHAGFNPTISTDLTKYFVLREGGKWPNPGSLHQ